MPAWLTSAWPLWVFLGSLLCGWIGWSLRKRFVTSEAGAAIEREAAAAVARLAADTDRRLDEHADRLGKAEAEIAMLRETLGHLPTGQELHALNLQLARTQGEMKAMAARFDGWQALGDRLQRQVDMMDEYLRKLTGNAGR